MKKFNFSGCVLGALLLVSTTMSGQWTDVSTAGIEGTCNVTRVFADGNDLYAFVTNGGLYKSTDGGSGWTLFNEGLPAGIEIRGVASSGASVYVAANKNGIYGSSKTSAGFTKLGTVPVLTNDFSALAAIADTLYLGINGKGVYKCVIPTAAYSQLTSGLSSSAAVTALAVDELGGVKRLYAGASANNGFYVKNAHNDTWVQKLINNESTSANQAQVISMAAGNGNVIIGGNSTARGLLHLGRTTDFSTFSFAKADTSLVSSTINGVAFDGQHIYLAATNGVWKSNAITEGVIRYTLLQTGLQSPRANTARVAVTADGKLCVAQQTGAYASANNGTSWTRTLNEKMSPVVINGLKENAGKLYAVTSSGIYESASGNGGDWLKLGNGLNSSVPLSGLSFGPLGTYATTDGALFKLNGSNWEAVTIDRQGWAWDHPGGSQITDIEQFNNGVKTCLFGSGWRSSGIYRFDGTNWDLYTTTTAMDVTTEMVGDADNGLTWSTADSTQSIIALKFMYDAPSNTLMSFGKNTIQYSFDFGDSWKWRMQNHNIRLNQGNIRTVSKKKSGSQTHVYMGTDITFSGAWALAKTEIGTTPENIGGNWANLSGMTNTKEVRDVITWDDSQLVIIRTTAPDIRISTDDGVTNKVFETGLTKSSNFNLSKIGNYVYCGNSNAISRYDVAAVPVFEGDAPAVNSITANSASLDATSSRAGTIYAVVLPKTAPAPSASQIIAGNDSENAPAPSASAAATAHVKATVALSGLNSNSNYTLYTVAVSETRVHSTVTALDFSTTVGTGLEATKLLSLSPNPTKGIVMLNTTVSDYKVYTLQGVEVLSGNGVTNQIDLSNQPAGIYVLKVDTSFVKVIKE